MNIVKQKSVQLYFYHSKSGWLYLNWWFLLTWSWLFPNYSSFVCLVETETKLTVTCLTGWLHDCCVLCWEHLQLLCQVDSIMSLLYLQILTASLLLPFLELSEINRVSLSPAPQYHKHSDKGWTITKVQRSWKNIAYTIKTKTHDFG